LSPRADSVGGAPLRIAVVGCRGYPYVYSGYETFVAAVAPRLAAPGHEVTVYCHRGLFTARPAVVDGVRLVYVPSIERKVLSQLSHSLLVTLHVVAGVRPDVVLYVNSANGPFGWLLRAGGIPSAINVDGLEWLRPKWKGIGSRYFRWASSVATRAFDVVVTDAHAMAGIYRREFGAESTTIAYGADVGFSERPERVRECGVEPGEYYLVVGRLIPDNNGDLIVRGFTRTQIRRKLLVVGDVPYRDAYAAAVRGTDDPRVHFPGYVRDQDLLRELYCNAYVYLHGHEFGGTNPALLNALACGCAIAALDTPFNREVLLDGRHGRLFPKEDSAVAHLLTTLDENPGAVRELGATARDRIAERYTWEQITDQYEAMLQRLARPR
jgi:glycosyltransferase involved in cell wall biosynthesis